MAKCRMQYFLPLFPVAPSLDTTVPLRSKLDWNKVSDDVIDSCDDLRSFKVSIKF